MTFTETPFLVLLAVTYGLWLLCRRHYRLTLALLLASSLLFYGYNHGWLLLLLLAYCVVDWGVALWIAARPATAKLAVGLGVTFNLTVLAFWKYVPLLLHTAAQAAPLLHLPPPAVPTGWVIPFGISFYAFTGVAYVVDVYRRTVPAERSLWRYTLSAAFFPHLVAGPILRPDDFLTKLRPGAMPTRTEAPLEALTLLARGYFKKAVLADRVSLAIDPFFSHVADGSTAGVWSLPYVYLYALQIYLDFSAYTDIARGLGLLFGFRWPDNFHLPYLAASLQDFWRRWHVTLSLFLKDYLYVPLGGSRKGEWRTNANLLATMLLGGLWHGASWSFLLWGGLHGVFLVMHRLWGRTALGTWLRGRTGVAGFVWHAACVVLTFHAVCLAWCFFRLTVLSESLACVGKWFVFDRDKLLVGGANDVSLWLLLGLYGAGVWLAHRARRLPVLDWLAAPGPLARGFAWGAAAMLLVLAVLLSPGGEKPPFIYFQF
jgi:D-alanyl-lipoteichoic acid acyltransferase DltB (MBOAT superfamily)